MVVMSFMVENLAPVARGVNGIVHQMHGSDVTLQIHSRSILYAAISIMQDVQQCCITQSVGLAVSGGRRRAVAPLNPLHARSTDRARGHLRLAGVLASSGMELALPPAVTRKGGLHAHRANRRAARRVLLRGVRGAGAVPAAPRWLLDRFRAGLWLGEHQVRPVRRQLRRGWCHRVRQARRHAEPQRPHRRGDQRLGTFRWDGQHRDDLDCHRISVSLPPSQERLLPHGRPRLLQLLREFHPLVRRDRLGVHGRRGLRHPGRPGRVAHPGRELRVRRRGRRERERRGKVRHRGEAARHRFRPGRDLPLIRARLLSSSRRLRAPAFHYVDPPAMLVLIVALGSQLAAPCPHAGRAAGETDAGWGFYRRGAIADAAAHFAAADSLCPGDHGAQVGLGFVRLRQGEARAAADHFLGATRSNAGDAEAWYGLGLARVRLGQRTEAAEAWRRTLRLAPGYEDAELQLLALGIDSGLARRPVVRPVDPDVAARTAGDGFQIRTTSGWRPFYVKGINLGVALPGHFPSDFPTDDSNYGRWLELIAGARANAVRVYTILPPAFYRSLNAWDDAHPDRALC